MRALVALVACVACGARSEIGGVQPVDASLPDHPVQDVQLIDVPAPKDVAVDVGPPQQVCTDLVLASDVEVQDLLIDDDWVYFSAFVGPFTGVNRVSKWGGPVQMYLTGASGVFAVDANDIYVIDAGGQISRVKKSGGTWVALGNTFDANGLVLDASNVYAIDSQGHALWTLPKTGGPGTKLVTFTSMPFGIAIDGTNLYVTTNVGLEKTDTSGSIHQTLASTPISLAVHTDATNVYWTSDYLHAMPKGGGSITNLSPQYSPYGFQHFTLDDTYVYWPLGNVLKAPKTGGAVTPATSTATNAQRVAVAECLYYARSEVNNTPAELVRTAIQ
jgi:hypothetical protein